MPDSKKDKEKTKTKTKVKKKAVKKGVLGSGGAQKAANLIKYKRRQQMAALGID